MKKPMIGITPLYDDRLMSYWMIPGYMKGVQACGGIPVILPLTNKEEDMEEIMSRLDGFLITGGPDIDPRLYGEEVVIESGILTPNRDHTEMSVLKKAIELDKPVLGICRGMQIMNVAMGGTLYQDLASQHPEDCDHTMPKPAIKPYHEVDIMKDTPLYQWIGQKVLGVNTLHHQAVKDLAEGLKVQAISKGGDL
ncbi:MAG: gamma-glutamyl-gamma-aminobutyrate hydrolase family protein, partial [Firmicutes bacterium]|nr:gamma-glutamyl-gamma-aminobutyrate hydrolase family protein [Bacillota bacterium]